MMIILWCNLVKALQCPSSVTLSNIQYSAVGTFSTTVFAVQFLTGYLGSSSALYIAGAEDTVNLILYKENADGTPSWAKSYASHATFTTGVTLSNDEQYIYALRVNSTLSLLQISTTDGSIVSQFVE